MALRCAIPEDQVLPAFVKGERWEFLGTVDAASARLWGFNDEAAETGVRYNGFHLFQEVKMSGRQLRLEEPSSAGVH